MGDQDRVEPRNVRRGNRKVDHDPHIEPAEQRVDHDRGAAGVDQEPRHPQPAKHRVIGVLERLGTKELRLRRLA
jgi:hypothetical protein